jgi:hypothetical protein
MYFEISTEGSIGPIRSLSCLLRDRGVRPANRRLKVGALRAASNLLLVENRNVVRRTTLGRL